MPVGLLARGQEGEAGGGRGLDGPGQESRGGRISSCSSGAPVFSPISEHPPCPVGEVEASLDLLDPFSPSPDCEALSLPCLSPHPAALPSPLPTLTENPASPLSPPEPPNPWDNVPDQPRAKAPLAPRALARGTFSLDMERPPSSCSSSSATSRLSSAVLEDPFDAEWATLAAR